MLLRKSSLTSQLNKQLLLFANCFSNMRQVFSFGHNLSKTKSSFRTPEGLSQDFASHVSILHFSMLLNIFQDASGLRRRWRLSGDPPRAVSHEPGQARGIWSQDQVQCVGCSVGRHWKSQIRPDCASRPRKGRSFYTATHLVALPAAIPLSQSLWLRDCELGFRSRLPNYESLWKKTTCILLARDIPCLEA